MRVLLDECVPRPLKRFLHRHTVSTVDQNLPYQQNLQAAGVSIIVLKAAGTRLQDLEPLMPALCERILAISPGQLLRVEG